MFLECKWLFIEKLKNVTISPKKDTLHGLGRIVAPLKLYLKTGILGRVLGPASSESGMT
jgi:hypothetical protein